MFRNTSRFLDYAGPKKSPCITTGSGAGHEVFKLPNSDLSRNVSKKFGPSPWRPLKAMLQSFPQPNPVSELLLQVGHLNEQCSKNH